jgi:HD superfamily phosphohydrolase YqeK
VAGCATWRGSLDDALARALELSIQHALKEGWLLHPNTIAAHNYMLLKKRGA